jgi:uracil-DNA glycosylase
VTGPVPGAEAMSWPVMSEAVRSCVACPELVATRTQVVVGVRPPGARLLLVGEAPGAQEDAAGVPFVGRAGQLLDELLGEVGLDRERVAVLNVLKCRPPGNRQPRPAEVAACRPWLERQLQLVDPQVVVALGATATRWALGPRARLSVARGAVHRRDGRPLLVTYHPSAALRFGPAGAPRAALREDLALARELLAGW